MKGASKHKKAACIYMSSFLGYIDRRAVRKNEAATRNHKFTVWIFLRGIEASFNMICVNSVVCIKKTNLLCAL